MQHLGHFTIWFPSLRIMHLQCANHYGQAEESTWRWPISYAIFNVFTKAFGRISHISILDDPQNHVVVHFQLENLPSFLACRTCITKLWKIFSKPGPLTAIVPQRWVLGKPFQFTLTILKISVYIASCMDEVTVYVRNSCSQPSITPSDDLKFVTYQPMRAWLRHK